MVEDPLPAIETKRLSRVVVTFALLIALFYGLTLSSIYREKSAPASLEFAARLGAGILAFLGEGATAEGNTIRSPRYGLTIGEACDALEPFGLYAAAVLASPVALSLRVLGLLGGAVILLTMNQLRIVSLYYVGIYSPLTFDTLHTEVWQPLIIVSGVAGWMIWARWALRVASLRK